MKRMLGAIALLTCIVLAACGMSNEPRTQAADKRLLDLDYVGTVNNSYGRPMADQYQDQDGCYWLSSDGNLVQVFEVFEYRKDLVKIKQSIPKCEKE